MKYVIVGGSVTAASGQAAIRRNRPEADIRVVADEPVPFYYRPLIPYLLDGSKTADEILFTDQPTAGTRAELIHDRCVRINPKKKVIGLQSGKELAYDKLLLAAGGIPIMLLQNMVGLDSKGVFTLRSLDDAIKIREYLPTCRTAVIIGGGLVGIKTAEALMRVGLAVTVIEQQPQILPLRADLTVAATIAARLKKQNINVLTKEAVTEIITQKGRANGVCLASGGIVPADLVIMAVGVRANIDFLLESGIKVDHGVVVNNRMRTSVPDIYAAGDLIRFIDQATGEKAVSGLWSNAVHTGSVAGCSMSGGRSEMPPMLSVMNSTEIAGLPIISAGLLHTQSDQYAVYTEAQGEKYRKLIFDQDRLVGMIFLGDVSRAGVYTNLIRNRIPLGDRRDTVIREVMTKIR